MLSNERLDAGLPDCRMVLMNAGEGFEVCARSGEIPAEQAVIIRFAQRRYERFCIRFPCLEGALDP